MPALIFLGELAPYAALPRSSGTCRFGAIRGSGDRVRSGTIRLVGIFPYPYLGIIKMLLMVAADSEKRGMSRRIRWAHSFHSCYPVFVLYALQ